MQSPKDRVANEIVALAYSGYRTGQHPDRGDGEKPPSRAEIKEDLELIAGLGVSLIRLYDSGPLSRQVLEVIEAEGPPMKVLLGAWLQAELSSHETCSWVTEPVPEEKLAAHREANRAEIGRAIELARAFPKTVIGVNVGNEALVEWNDHLVSIEAMTSYLREVKAAIPQPVSTADNYVAWAQHAAALGAVADFALVHTYPVWEGKTLAEALAYTEQNLLQVRAALPGLPIAIGEAGWPSVATEFEGRASEDAQATHLRELIRFARDNEITVFLFEAFDEDWKGDANPDGAEKHWGVFDISRRPKAVITRGVFSD